MAFFYIGAKRAKKTIKNVRDQSAWHLLIVPERHAEEMHTPSPRASECGCFNSTRVRAATWLQAGCSSQSTQFADNPQGTDGPGHRAGFGIAFQPYIMDCSGAGIAVSLFASPRFWLCRSLGTLSREHPYTFARCTCCPQTPPFTNSEISQQQLTAPDSNSVVRSGMW